MIASATFRCRRTIDTNYQDPFSNGMEVVTLRVISVSRPLVGIVYTLPYETKYVSTSNLPRLTAAMTQPCNPLRG